MVPRPGVGVGRRKEVSMAGQPIVYVELASSNPAAAGQFFGQLFGWSLHHEPSFDYHMFRTESGPGGGLVQADGKQHDAGDALVYVGVDDIDATLAQAEALGGKTIQPKMEIPGTGWMAILTESGGGRVALYTEMQRS